MSKSPYCEPRRIDVGASREHVQRLARRQHRRLSDEAARSRRIAVAGNTHARDLDSHRSDSLAHPKALIDVTLAAIEHQQPRPLSQLGATREGSFYMVILGPLRAVQVEMIDIFVIAPN